MLSAVLSATPLTRGLVMLLEVAAPRAVATLCFQRPRWGLRRIHVLAEPTTNLTGPSWTTARFQPSTWFIDVRRAQARQ